MKTWIAAFISRMMLLMAQALADKGHKGSDDDGVQLREDRFDCRQH